ncbi:lantibiotic immunity ABC transporter MutE/EpiE family permease subunit [Clostridium sp. CM028]|uniref:lantibiotic immunity ABC transporter MutE/EpiE family permease subunit n=1 Tax=unclassified Clostridium TaxID=2614128 RepID=UPI001C6F5CEC|nr:MULTISPECIES: lantibiotic immunity ABC transporter MutE/EpiE family permease subunit [unclassified Clostridium]MBW9146498.1 lantibiotic immunity ABC transporter MutE/EpiE family permease subunit [Clostridium sp. CM027]MBW9150081.1 lantibiotic immunity ABC transporter MutE/EpiE family permease subunit [Clostridium sp. CM028]UVE39619.1 lantibiotic immunity ABC transporter MutE/EpiE family permease subunit [Clostridium sp. CM027]WLC60320.1 lantibiotic immunity ABC transporter MutE/EpiE family p
MLEYLQAENLKCKRTFIKKIIFLAPMVTFLIALSSVIWFQANSFNSWYMMILPGYISIMAVMTNEREEKKLRYRAVFGLPISLKKVWISKVLVNGFYMLLSCMVLSVGIILGGYYFPVTVPFFRALVAAVLIAVTSLWQIPLCMFLAKKLGMIGAVLINVCGSIMLSSLTAITSTWWICPYSWTARIMCPVLGYLPNGLKVETGSPLLNPIAIPIGIILSLILFALLLIVTANWFSKQEVN